MIMCGHRYTLREREGKLPNLEETLHPSFETLRTALLGNEMIKVIGNQYFSKKKARTWTDKKVLQDTVQLL